VRFWDASAVAPLLVAEPRGEEMLTILRSDQGMVVWWGSRIECTSALRRREREGGLSTAAVGEALGLLTTLSAAWSEILPGEVVRVRAERALAVHPLRAADALQLAAALVWRGDSVASRELVCLDDRLRDAALREGFALVPD